ncbi:MarR family winged helix-turn-helix transcriptional regulator [Stigmatella aurantiaca]|uniref:Transcriptional regulator MarR family n=1 Tax=Stigmatella aurantiaca (strain DW4/3-1) TaxID=378806 RepID=Q08ST7_STIAD|nr:MarR family transcriptional regulator [Stigmatella aurantiaca]ADO72910.1 Transcriptional regulator, MarR family [Stigmatella aurantiaca DW4/3-1]EAU63528.1 transcriptional regulator MarR family [Stigmatella aurantiaca DW4/3-1]
MEASATLGTLLRTLLDHLDGAVEEAYRNQGLDYRPRYTPVMKVLRHEPATIRELATRAGLSHSAMSQTIAQMTRHGLVTAKPGQDARERIITLTPKAAAMLTALERQWRVTEAAARSLDTDLGMPLADVLRQAIDALDRRSFGDRIAQAATSLSDSQESR